MARCRCRCLCCVFCILLSFLFFSHLFLYILVTVCISMARTPLTTQVHFVASGSNNSRLMASYPVSPFWKLKLDDRALWNWLQHLLDLEHNPLLKQRGLGGRAEPGSIVPSRGPEHASQGFAPSAADLKMLPQQIREFVLSMRHREYPLLLDQPGLCGGEGKPLLVLAIKSQECNFENRRVIRKTWGRAGPVAGEEGGGGVVRRVFLLGTQEPSARPCFRSADFLERESALHGDLLQWDFRDTFFNLTLKDVLLWPWLARRCPHARFVFKGDDDVFVRTPALLDFLRREEDHCRAMGNISDFFVGDLIDEAKPVREVSHKYYIPESFYWGRYPAYAGGGGVVYSGSLAMRLNEVSKRVHLFPIDDVYVGMCLFKLGLAPIHNSGFLTFDFPTEEKDNPCAYLSIFLVHKRTPSEITHLWRELRVLQAQCVNQTLAATNFTVRRTVD